MTATLTNRPDQTREGIVRRVPPAILLALKVLLVGIICSLATEIGFAHKVPPHYISVLWPTNAIVFAVLVLTPVRYWWAYIFAGYFTAILHDARAGFPLANFLFLLGDFIEILVAALVVRRFADGLGAFDSLRSLVVYIAGAAVLAPFLSAFVAAFAGGTESYWFYWRVWFLSEGLAYLMLAPAILTWIKVAGISAREVSFARFAEAGLLALGLIAVSMQVFTLATEHAGKVPVLVYLPLPFLLWAAVRFGPAGINSALLIVAFIAISGVVKGRGPFAPGDPTDNVLPLQLFLITLSLPLMCLGALVAERRLKTNALRESEARFRAMADSAPVLIWMSGVDKLLTFLNKSWLDFTGRALDRQLSGGWVESVHPDDRERCLGAYLDAFDARREFTIEYRLRRHDGEYRWVSDRGVPRRAPEGTFLGYIGCADDITPQREAELRVQRLRAELTHVARVSTMGELAASLAHELNQPLAAILGNAEAAQKMLSREKIDLQELRAICSDIVSEDHRARDVIRRVRTLASKEPPVIVPLDARSVINEVVRLVSSDAVLRQTRVSVEVAPDLPPVLGDRIELQQVMLNLLVNAFDAMNQCAADEREVRVSAVLDGDDAVKVAVRDRGTGVHTNELERIFQPFHTTKQHGLGIGLSISRTIIAVHGGRLWAENNPDRGTSFCFTVPVAKASRESR